MHTVNHHVGQRCVAIDIKVAAYGSVAIHPYIAAKDSVAKNIRKTSHLQVFHRQVELGKIVMALRQGVIVNILRRNYPVFRINRCCVVGNTAQFALPFKRYATAIDYGQSPSVKTTEFRSGLHGEILEERHQLARLAILVPSSIGRPRRQGFVGRQIPRNDIGLPIALLRTVIAR